MEPCGDEDTFAVSQENHMDIATNVAPPLKRRDYKAPNAICYKEPPVMDMDVVSWKERDRMAQVRNNLTDPITATDYKGPSFVGYMEKMEDGHDS